ncbi:hypothetical protein [Endozoicomonas arenosclerae]|nr:hypothetical protein [Endozoicomonas arenosclerae]
MVDALIPAKAPLLFITAGARTCAVPAGQGLPHDTGEAVSIVDP